MSETSQKTVGVVLAGCGVFDGSEIHEATLTLLALDRANAKVMCMAPDMNQFHVIDHILQSEMPETRSVLTESGRIARGTIFSLDKVSPDDIDALIFPGGFGAAKNLFTFAIDGVNGKVHHEVARFITTMHAKGKPLGFMCIAPVIAAKVLGEFRPELTIGNDENTAEAIVQMGAQHVMCAVDEIVIDEKNKIVSTPAYMIGPSISHIAKGIDKLVDAVLKMA